MGQYLRSFLLLAAATLALLVGESTAFAQRGYYGPGYGPRQGYYAPYYGGGHAHDGFYMRLDVGMGYLSASETYAGASDDYSGLGVTYGAAFGGVVAPNLILFGELLGTTVVDSDYSWAGVSRPWGALDVTMYGFGPGIAYYLEPANMYLSGSLVFTRMSFSFSDTGQSLEDTHLGIGMNLMVGKEWWVARDWGMGVAGQLHVARMGDSPQGYETHMGAVAVSV